MPARENATCMNENKAPGLFWTFTCMIINDLLNMQKQMCKSWFQESSKQKHGNWCMVLEISSLENTICVNENKTPVLF